MKKILQNPFAILIAIALPLIALAAQQQASLSTASTKIEGTITKALNTGSCGMPTFTLKTEEGKEYAIHLGMLKNAEGQIFAPKIGETIVVTGTPCCGIPGQGMIHGAEIALGQETFRAPAGVIPGMMPGMMMGPGQPGPGMVMGPGMMMGQGQPGPGMMMVPGPMGQVQPGQGWCPGMTAQTMPWQVMPSQGQAAPGAIYCCGGPGVGAASAGYPMQQPTAPPAEPDDTE